MLHILQTLPCRSDGGWLPLLSIIVLMAQQNWDLVIKNGTLMYMYTWSCLHVVFRPREILSKIHAVTVAIPPHRETACVLYKMHACMIHHITTLYIDPLRIKVYVLIPAWMCYIHKFCLHQLTSVSKSGYSVIITQFKHNIVAIVSWGLGSCLNSSSTD